MLAYTLPDAKNNSEHLGDEFLGGRESQLEFGDSLLNSERVDCPSTPPQFTNLTISELSPIPIQQIVTQVEAP